MTTNVTRRAADRRARSNQRHANLRSDAVRDGGAARPGWQHGLARWRRGLDGRQDDRNLSQRGMG